MDESDDLLVSATADGGVVAASHLTWLDGAVPGGAGDLRDDGLDALLDRVDAQTEGVADEPDGFGEAHVANDGSVRHASLELLGGGADSLGAQHSLAIGGEVVDAAGFDVGDFLASGAEGDDEVVQHESGVDADADDRDAVLLGEFVEFLGHVGVLGLGAGHLFGDAHDVDASGNDGAQIGDLVAEPRGCGDSDDVDVVGIEDGGGMSCDGGPEWISAEDLANIFAVQSWVDVDGPDEFQSVLGSR